MEVTNVPTDKSELDSNGQWCDVLVIGGGIAGCGIARDLSLRGLRVILVEKSDFGSGTTGMSTRIVHGGIRYLETFEFGLVREGLRERATLLRVAANLVKPLRFVIPIYSDSTPGRWKTKVGMVVYDLLGHGCGLPGHRFLSSDETKKIIPSIREEGLVGSYLYFDAQVEMVERLCIENLVSVERTGGEVWNHCEVFKLLRDGDQVVGVEVRTSRGDSIIHPKFVVNATGPWLDSFLSRTLGNGGKGHLIVTKGVHLFTRERFSEVAIVVYSSEGVRLLFAIPWLGGSLLGTTDTLYEGLPDSVNVDRNDIEYILWSLSRRIKDMPNEYLTSYAGLRPLVRGEVDSPSKISRAYSIIDHRDEGITNLLSVAGVKITDFRSASMKVSDIVCRRLGIHASCVTDKVKLPGADNSSRPSASGGLAFQGNPHLFSLYGYRTEEVLAEAEKDNSLLERICPHNPNLLVEARFSTLREHAKTLSDFMIRRSYIFYTPCRGLDGVDRVAALMGSLLSWTREERDANVEEYARNVGMGKAAVGDGFNQA